MHTHTWQNTDDSGAGSCELLPACEGFTFCSGGPDAGREPRDEVSLTSPLAPGARRLRPSTSSGLPKGDSAQETPGGARLDSRQGSDQALTAVREMGTALPEPQCRQHVSFSNSILGHDALCGEEGLAVT